MMCVCGQSLSLSESQFLHLYNGDCHTHFTEADGVW